MQRSTRSTRDVLPILLLVLGAVPPVIGQQASIAQRYEQTRQRYEAQLREAAGSLTSQAQARVERDNVSSNCSGTPRIVSGGD